VPARSTIEYELPMEPLKQNAYVLRASARKSREKRFLARQQRIKTHQRYLVLGAHRRSTGRAGGPCY
jgi:hypothetical protein